MSQTPLRKIPVSELQLGMKLHRLEGSWLRHPFWRSRFVLDDAADLQRLQASGVQHCWIEDTTAPAPATAPDTGAVVAPAAPLPAASAAPPQLQRHTPAATGPDIALPADGPQVPLAQELERAAEICNRGRQAVMSVFNEARMGRAVDIEGCLPLVEDITASVMRHPGALVSLARLKTQDDYTYLHSMAVCALMVALARQLGLDESACRGAGVAGLMHDVGKALMPLQVLNKPARLTDGELAVMRTHPEHGHALLLAAGNASPETLDVALHHHEKMDGTGYPHRLAGEQISLLARMGAVCDVYDAITSNRPYKSGWDPAQSLARMASWEEHFDADVFAAFVRSLGIYPNGSVVRLASHRLAVVVDQTAGALLTPQVKVFHCTRTDRALAHEVVDLSNPACGDRIVARETGVGQRFGHLEALWLDPNLQARARGA
jgi:HD-GYP domain-containing protein (c-di-GMP phosphodiesterase class II)